MNNLILASPNQERLTSWREGLSGYVSTLLIKNKLITDRLDALRSDVVRIKPQVLLLDFDLLGFDGSHGVVSLRRLCAETKVIILSGNIPEEVEWELLKAGMRGCCRNDIEPALLKQVVMAVQEGELWIRRTLTGRLIEELAQTTSSKIKTFRATLGLLNKLTQREYDIAVRVGNGECNKQIAQSCDITERTVKAHLTEIFIKLGVTDRLNLALVLAADNRIACANSDIASSVGTRSKDGESFGKIHHLPNHLVA
jgi:DNA-binding NarL/FixJ family response regulator